jgi:hypothetical protein
MVYEEIYWNRRITASRWSRATTSAARFKVVNNFVYLFLARICVIVYKARSYPRGIAVFVTPGRK